MRKSSNKFHSKRSSGRSVRSGYGHRHDYCAETHGTVNSKDWQLNSNSLLCNLLSRVGVFA
jgi:hypothetical protein